MAPLIGSREIRLADFHVHDVAARGGGGLGMANDLHDVERGDVRHAGGGAKTVGHHLMRRAASTGRQSSSLSDLRLIYCAGGKSGPFFPDFSLHRPTMRLEIVNNCPRSPTRLATITQVRQAARRSRSVCGAVGSAQFRTHQMAGAGLRQPGSFAST